jgi:50S ribosomal protein L16 3-hydroxylase
MTWSIGFRAPQEGELARELLLGLADEAFEGVGDALYRDPKQAAVGTPAALPHHLGDFARQAIAKALKDTHLLDSLLGEYLTEPKPQVWFDPVELEPDLSRGVKLDRRTKMMYDERHVFINGESFRVAGKDARNLRQLADVRELSARNFESLSQNAKEALIDWALAGWLHPQQNSVL